MCGRWSLRRRTLAVKPTRLVWRRLNSWSAMVRCLCAFFFINTDYYDNGYDYATESLTVDTDTASDDRIHEYLDIIGTWSHCDWLATISHSARDWFLLLFELNWHHVSHLPPCVIEHPTWVSLPSRPVWFKSLFERRQVWHWCRWELCVFVSWTIHREKVSDRCGIVCI